jgi:glutaryl-CoA dehydrogenase
MFKGLDFYSVDELLDDEELLARDMVRDFVSKEVIPIIEKHDREETFPMHLVSKMGELGLFGSSLHGYGCAGMSGLGYGVCMQELERGDSGLRSFASVQGSLCMYPIYTYGSEEQKEKFLPPMAEGKLIGCFGLTEPDYGSNPSGMITKVKKDGEGWILNGAKMWITNGCIADVAIVWAKDEEGEIRGFLVEKGTPGFSTRRHKGKFSLRASVTSELIFQDVKLGPEALLPNVKGLKGPLGCLTQARYGIAFGVIGAAMAAYDEVLAYTKERIVADKPTAAYQMVQDSLVEMLSEITKGQLLAWRLGKLYNAKKMKHFHVSLAKRNNCKIALDVCRSARDLLGANGISDEYQTGRHMRNLESVITYEGTHNMHTLILGRHITGEDAIFR